MTHAPIQEDLYSITVCTEHHVRIVIDGLVTDSQWFAVTPLPDDIWRVTVKHDAIRLISNFDDRNHP